VLIKYIVEQFGPNLEHIDYISTFKMLAVRYEQNEYKPPAEDLLLREDTSGVEEKKKFNDVDEDENYFRESDEEEDENPLGKLAAEYGDSDEEHGENKKEKDKKIENNKELLVVKENGSKKSGHRLLPSLQSEEAEESLKNGSLKTKKRKSSEIEDEEYRLEERVTKRLKESKKKLT